MRIYLILIPLFLGRVSYAQVSGSVLDPAAPAINPLDPNGDGFITSTGVPFSGSGDDEAEFELPFLPLQQYQSEPGADNQYQAGCEIYETVHDEFTSAGYYFYQDPDAIPDNGDERIFFRLRVARYSNGSTAFSILIDTDYRFGFSGPERDPNAVAGNPGFEKEVAVFNNTGFTGGVRVFNVDGRADATVVDFQASLTTHYQVSYAFNNHPSCIEVPAFIDMYVPFSSLHIPSSRQIRMAVAANEDIGTSLGGGASDIGGVDGIAMPVDDDQFIAAINGFSPIAVNNPANIAPYALNKFLTIDENTVDGTLVHNVSASDSNGDVVTYSIEGGNTGDAFSIDAATGEISVKTSSMLDVETIPAFELVVRVSDGRLYDNAIITIQLNDVNEPPVMADAIVSVNEHLPTGTVIHNMAAADADVNAVLAYSILPGNNAAIFSIDPVTGDLSLKDQSALDYETANIHYLHITVTDGVFSDEAFVTINVKDVNEVPLIKDATLSLDENSPAGFPLLTLQGTDPDAGAILQYSIVDGNVSNAFAAGTTTGEITVSNASAIDFETTPVYKLKARVSDGSLYSDAVITIHIRDVNEPPVVMDDAISIQSRLQNGEIVYTVNATDPDAGDVLEFSLQQMNDQTIFFIDPASGEIGVNEVKPLIENKLISDLTVVATDKSGLIGTGNIHIEISRLPDRSDIVPLKGFSPNHDGENELWLIRGIEWFPDNNIKIFNRWGVLLYEKNGYQNDTGWGGEINGVAVGAETTYFYIINVAGFEPLTGYVIIKP